jgi:predicted RNA-binding Zn-ribbon protein involved in translation (DUF1610 family)
MSGDDDGSNDTAGVDIDADPVGAFETLGHELRLAIVEELAARQRASAWQPDPASFADLRTAVDADDSGRFNYHLNELVGSYVERTDEGYVLSPAGYEVSTAVLGGSHANADVGPVEGSLDHDCPGCGTTLRGRYEDGYLSILCPDDGYLFGNTVPPAAAAGRGVEAIAALAERDIRRAVEAAVDGVCPECYGDIETTLPADAPPRSPEASLGEGAVYARFECDRCGLTFTGNAAAVVLDHPAVVAFHHDHGVDVRDRSYVEFENAPETVVSKDPPRTRVEFCLEDERLVVTLDGDAGVTGTERRAE